MRTGLRQLTDSLMRVFAGMRLNRKFTLIISLIVFVPVMILAALLFSQMQETIIQEKIASVRLNLEETRTRAAKTADACRIAAQAVAGNTRLLSYLGRVRSKAPDAVDTLESIDFYRNDISNLARMVEANPYLYAVRVYINSDAMPEMFPILYRAARSQRLDWESESLTERWCFDYSDTLFPAYVSTQTPHLMGLIMPLRDSSIIGVIETAARMDVMLPELFMANSEQCLLFTDAQQNRHYDMRQENPWRGMADTIFSLADTLPDGAAVRKKLDGQTVALASLRVPELGGRLVQIVSLAPELLAVSRQMTLFFTLLTVALGTLILVINGVVRQLLHRFYALLDSISQVQEGRLDVKIPDNGFDEVHLFATEISRMLETIRRLLRENTQRILLAKNAELRALQNQINAHFIYNVLESIKMMAEVGEQYEIANALTALGKMLRYNMRWASGNVTVAEEIEYIRDYMALVNLRYDYRIHLALKLPDCVLSQQIPKMSLQPIVENAIAHGIEPGATDAYIYIKAVQTPIACRIEITDPGCGIDEATLTRLQANLASQSQDEAASVGSQPRNGVGLKNIHDRLRLAFGDEYGLTVLSKKEYYTKVIINIPPVTIGEETVGHAADC